MKMWAFIFKMLFLLSLVNGEEEYNLYGEAGQAYSIETYLGNPKQKLYLIVDTGSTTMAIAAFSGQTNDTYYNKSNSSTFLDSSKEVEAKYSQGMWVGRLVSDEISFPSLPNVPGVRSDFAAIITSHKFFMNGSGWQGLLGLAYPPIAAWGNDVAVGSWLQSVDCCVSNAVSFELKLCGPVSDTNSTHFGKFSVFVNNTENTTNPEFRTPILHKRWYEIGVLSVNVFYVHLSYNDSENDVPKAKPLSCIAYNPPQTDVCVKLNAEKSIVDSGTTNIRLPDEIFKKVVDTIRRESEVCKVLILDDFWYHGAAACWPEPQEWDLPWIGIDLLNAQSDNSYFVLQIPPQNYMRIVSAHNNSGAVSEYCYKLGLEAGGKDTVLGYTAMEGLQVTFNRSADWIGFSTSNCGPPSQLSGPFYVSYSLVRDCDLIKPHVDASIQAAQWGLLTVSLIAAGIILYVLAPCLRYTFFNPSRVASRFSISRNALFDQEYT